MIYARSSTAEWLAFNQFDGGSNPPGRTNGFSLPGVLGRQGVQSPSSRVRFLVPVPIISSVVNGRDSGLRPRLVRVRISPEAYQRDLIAGLTDKALGFEPRRRIQGAPCPEGSRPRFLAAARSSRASSFPLCRQASGSAASRQQQLRQSGARGRGGERGPVNPRRRFSSFVDLIQA